MDLVRSGVACGCAVKPYNLALERHLCDTPGTMCSLSKVKLAGYVYQAPILLGLQAIIVELVVIFLRPSTKLAGPHLTPPSGYHQGTGKYTLAPIY